MKITEKIITTRSYNMEVSLIELLYLRSILGSLSGGSYSDLYATIKDFLNNKGLPDYHMRETAFDGTCNPYVNKCVLTNAKKAAGEYLKEHPEG